MLDLLEQLDMIAYPKEEIILLPLRLFSEETLPTQMRDMEVYSFLTALRHTTLLVSLPLTSLLTRTQKKVL